MFFWNKPENVVTEKDIQEGIYRITVRINSLEEIIDGLDLTKEEDRKTHESATKELSRLRDGLRDAYDVLDRYKKTKFWIAPKDWLICGGTFVTVLFVICLSRENPEIVRLSQWILKLFPIPTKI